jgi:radical SAM superfamily enzyme YgiQ (UPF0313 family)
MKIAVVNVSGRLCSEGSRLVSALLKRANHSVRSVFLARQAPLVYEREEIELLHEILKDVDLVMVAVYSAYAIRAAKVTEFVHERYPGIKVIWGGPHCISAPEPSLRYADGVCFAEADEVVVDLVNKMDSGIDYLSTSNFAFNVGGTHIVNDVVPPFSELDSLPYPDYDMDGQFLLDRGLFPMTKEIFYKYSAIYPFGVPTCYTLTSRGCPHRCSYCNNCRYIAMHGRNPMRYRSVDNFIGELEHVLGALDIFRTVGFADDDFFMRSPRQLEDFAEKYRKRIGLPFWAMVSANTYRKEKMEILLSAGMKLIGMGVQSGSQRILDEVYNRSIKVSKTKAVLHQIEPYTRTHNLKLLLDFIIDNPYENRDDIIQTYRYLVELPPEVRLSVFRLVFFPGTPIYENALKDGFINPFNIMIFRGFVDRNILYQNNYETFLVLLVQLLHRCRFLQYIPKSFLNALAGRPLRDIASMFPKSFYVLLIKITGKMQDLLK